jgi:hypothetical protein|tara:strand:+ start:4048 stop:4566 length:519 start_codon:yes stop_codon:yes gene_type:complete
MENKLKYLVPTAAVTSLFLIGCGDDDVSTADDSCPGTTGTEALLGGSWKMTKEDGVSTQGSEFEDEYGDKYTYTLVYKFECEGDFTIKQVLTYTDDDQNPLLYLYEGSWDFNAADETMDIAWANKSGDVYEWDFEIETVSESLLKGTLYTPEYDDAGETIPADTVSQEFEKQ